MEKKIKEYKMWLAAFLKYYASVLQISEDLSHGELVDADTLELLLQKMSISKRNLLCLKEMLGYCDGLSFLEDNAFKGFEIKEGRISGDTSSALQIVKPWYVGFPDKPEINHYKYEVACFIISLCQQKEAV